MQAASSKALREVDYLFKTLEKEWERSGKTTSKRKIGQDEIDMFSRYYRNKMREYEREQEELNLKPIKTVLGAIKEMSIIGRIAKKICEKATLQSTKEKGYFLLELDKEERKTLENIIGSED